MILFHLYPFFCWFVIHSWFPQIYVTGIKLFSLCAARCCLLMLYWDICPWVCPQWFWGRRWCLFCYQCYIYFGKRIIFPIFHYFCIPWDSLYNIRMICALKLSKEVSYDPFNFLFVWLFKKLISYFCLSFSFFILITLESCPLLPQKSAALGFIYYSYIFSCLCFSLY